VYVTMLFGAWMAVGRPPGPEQWVLEELRRRFGKRRRNGS
jgi:hypothetical protein